MTAIGDFLQGLVGKLSQLEVEQHEAIEQVAGQVATSIAEGGVLHVFGTGHSQLVALELCDRAAGLGAVRSIYDPALSPVQARRAAATERLAGYAQVVLSTEELRAGETLLIVSNSGVNAVPVDVALAAKEQGLCVVAVTSVAQSTSAPIRHDSGKRLLDVADVVIDTGAPAGDGILALDDGAAAGPVSSLLSVAVLHAITARTAELLLARGHPAPMLVSQNLDVSDDVNDHLYARYADRRGK